MKDVTPERLNELGACFTECKKVIDHLIDTKKLSHEEELSFFLNIYIMKSLDLRIDKKMFADFTETAYDLMVKAREQYGIR